jgi:hypothetical protein
MSVSASAERNERKRVKRDQRVLPSIVSLVLLVGDRGEEQHAFEGAGSTKGRLVLQMGRIENERRREREGESLAQCVLPGAKETIAIKVSLPWWCLWDMCGMVKRRRREGSKSTWTLRDRTHPRG